MNNATDSDVSITTRAVLRELDYETKKDRANAGPSEWMAMFGVIVGVVVVLLGAVGNVLTILAYHRNRKLQISFNHLITNLCVVDLVFSSVVMPAILPSMVIRENIYSSETCVIVGFLYYWTMASSVVNLVMIAANRYVGIVRSHKYRKMFSNERTKWWVLVVWISAPLLYVAFIITGSFTWRQSSLRCALSTSSSSIVLKYYQTIVNIMLQIVPTITLIFLYRAILQKVKRCRKSVDLHRPPFAAPPSSGDPAASPRLARGLRQLVTYLQPISSDTQSRNNNMPENSQTMSYLQVPSAKSAFGGSQIEVYTKPVRSSPPRARKCSARSSPTLLSGSDSEGTYMMKRESRRRRSYGDESNRLMENTTLHSMENLTITKKKEQATNLSTIDSEPTSRTLSLDNGELVAASAHQEADAGKHKETSVAPSFPASVICSSHMNEQNVTCSHEQSLWVNLEQNESRSLSMLAVPNMQDDSSRRPKLEKAATQPEEERRGKRRRNARVDQPVICSLLIDETVDSAKNKRKRLERCESFREDEELMLRKETVDNRIEEKADPGKRHNGNYLHVVDTQTMVDRVRAKSTDVGETHEEDKQIITDEVNSKTESEVDLPSQVKNSGLPDAGTQEEQSAFETFLVAPAGPARGEQNDGSKPAKQLGHLKSAIKRHAAPPPETGSHLNRTSSAEARKIRSERIRRMSLPTKARSSLRRRVKNLRSRSESQGSRRRLPQTPAIVIDHATTSEDTRASSLVSGIWMAHDGDAREITIVNPESREDKCSSESGVREDCRWCRDILRKFLVPRGKSQSERQSDQEQSDPPRKDGLDTDRVLIEEELTSQIIESSSSGARASATATCGARDDDLAPRRRNHSFECLSCDERRNSLSSRVYRYSVGQDDTVSCAGHEYRTTRSVYVRNPSRDIGATNGPVATLARKSGLPRQSSLSKTQRKRSVVDSSGQSSVLSLDSLRRHRRKNAERHLVTTGLVICAAFALCVLPTSVISVLGSIAKVKITPDLKFAAGMLSWLHAVINPILYGLLNPSYRREFRSMLHDLKLWCMGTCWTQKLHKTASQTTVGSAHPITSKSWNPSSGLDKDKEGRLSPDQQNV